MRREGTFGLLAPEVATPLALVLVELVQNAVEHGLARPGRHGPVDVAGGVRRSGRDRLTVDGRRRRRRAAGRLRPGGGRRARACRSCGPWSRASSAGRWPCGRRDPGTRVEAATLPLRPVRRCLTSRHDTTGPRRCRRGPVVTFGWSVLRGAGPVAGGAALESAALVLAHGTPDAGVLAGLESPLQAGRRRPRSVGRRPAPPRSAGGPARCCRSGRRAPGLRPGRLPGGASPCASLLCRRRRVGGTDACETVHERSHARQGPFRSVSARGMSSACSPRGDAAETPDLNPGKRIGAGTRSSCTFLRRTPVAFVTRV